MRITKQNKGFTLIELMVVITIIGILSVGGAVTYIVQIQKARDGTRITDLGQLQSMMEEYYQDNSYYPLSAVGAATFATSIKQYATHLPKDPKSGQPCNNSGSTVKIVAIDGEICEYSYASVVDDNGLTQGAYELSTSFESEANILGKAETSKGGAGSATPVIRYRIGVPAAAVLNTDVTTKSQCTGVVVGSKQEATNTSSLIICGT